MAVWAVLIYYLSLRGLGGAATAVSGHVLGGTEIIAPYSHETRDFLTRTRNGHGQLLWWRNTYTYSQ